MLKTWHLFTPLFSGYVSASQSTSSDESVLAQVASQKAPLAKKMWKNQYTNTFPKYSAAKSLCVPAHGICGNQPEDHGSTEWWLPWHSISQLKEAQFSLQSSGTKCKAGGKKGKKGKKLA